MYPKVHTLAGANLHWIGVEAQGTPNATEAHHSLLEPSHQAGRPDHYGTLEGGYRTRTKLGAISTTQLGAPKKSPLGHHKAWEDLHNLIGGPQEIATEAPQSLGRSSQLNWRSPSNPLSRIGFQEPKSNKLNELSHESPRRTQTDAIDAMARTHKVHKSFSPKSHQSN
jgi:hypothetical protein